MNLFGVRTDTKDVAEPIARDDAADRDLVARIARGDRPAFETLYRAHIRRVVSYIATVVGSRGGADELASDTMVSVWRAAPRYAGRARVLTWILAIAHHRAVESLRRKRLNVVSLDAASDLPDATYDPLAAAIRTSERDALEAALATLSPDHRAVLDLMFAHDRTQTEIAAIVRVPVATVKTRAFHAKRNLRDALARNDRREDIS